MPKVGGVLAWHPEVAMTREEIDEFLSGRWIARVATVGKDGYPRVFPFWYYWDGENIYITPTRKRGTYLDLKSDPRCSVIVDMDDRPLMGMRSNMAKAVQITGDAEIAGSQELTSIEAGPWRGEYSSDQAVALVTSRYLLRSRDGALGTTGENFLDMITAASARSSQLIKDNTDRVRQNPTEADPGVGFFQGPDPMGVVSSLFSRLSARASTRISGGVVISVFVMLIALMVLKPCLYSRYQCKRINYFETFGGRLIDIPTKLNGRGKLTGAAG